MLSDPTYLVNERRMEIIRLCEKLDMLAEKKTDKCRAELVNLVSKLEALSPLAVVSRGYGVVTDADGKTVKSVEQLDSGSLIDVTLSDGSINAVVKSVRRK